jgi:CRP-like cAMP-binding protein
MDVLRRLLDRLTLPSRPGGEAGEILDMAAELLAGPNGSVRLDPRDALVVARYMEPTRLPAGTTFIREGDTESTDYMLLVVDGEVTVETIVVSRTDPVTVRVLGPGSMHGDAGLLDGKARSASCTATSDVIGAVLTREKLNLLLQRHPQACAKLLIAIGASLALRLRESTRTLKSYTVLTRALQQELDRAMPHR